MDMLRAKIRFFAPDTAITGSRKGNTGWNPLATPTDLADIKSSVSKGSEPQAGRFLHHLDSASLTRNLTLFHHHAPLLEGSRGNRHATVKGRLVLKPQSTVTASDQWVPGTWPTVQLQCEIYRQVLHRIPSPPADAKPNNMQRKPVKEYERTNILKTPECVCCL